MRATILAVLLTALVAVGQALAQSAPLRLELNRLEAREGGVCRVWLVLSNGGGEALDPVRLDLVLFGRDGIIARRLAVDVGPLPPGRTQARIFDIAGQPCENVGSVLLNDMLACSGTDAGARNACIERTALASRVDGVAFQK
jgi:hypothetical protein